MWRGSASGRFLERRASGGGGRVLGCKGIQHLLVGRVSAIGIQFRVLGSTFMIPLSLQCTYRGWFKVISYPIYPYANSNVYLSRFISIPKDQSRWISYRSRIGITADVESGDSGCIWTRQPDAESYQ